MQKNSKIYIAGHKGLVGSALYRQLIQEGYSNLIYRTHQELDLLDWQLTRAFFDLERPEYIFMAAAKVGGIVANNTYPADFIYENLQVQNHLIHVAYLFGVKKLLFLGSSCIYPKNCLQPIKEEYLLTSALEPTNEPYAISKIAGLKMCQSYNRQYKTNFIACMPTNLYGSNDNYDLQNSYVLPAMLRKFHEAKINNIENVILRGDGSPRREFLHVDMMAQAAIYLMLNFHPTVEQNQTGEMFVNIGSGEDITIRELAEIIKNIVGYQGKIVWDTSKPNGTMQKLLDVSKLKQMGWQNSIGLEEGVRRVYEEFVRD